MRWRSDRGERSDGDGLGRREVVPGRRREMALGSDAGRSWRVVVVSSSKGLHRRPL